MKLKNISLIMLIVVLCIFMSSCVISRACVPTNINDSELYSSCSIYNGEVYYLLCDAKLRFSKIVKQENNSYLKTFIGIHSKEGFLISDFYIYDNSIYCSAYNGNESAMYEISLSNDSYTPVELFRNEYIYDWHIYGDRIVYEGSMTTSDNGEPTYSLYYYNLKNGESKLICLDIVENFYYDSNKNVLYYISGLDQKTLYSYNFDNDTTTEVFKFEVNFNTLYYVSDEYIVCSRFLENDDNEYMIIYFEDNSIKSLVTYKWSAYQSIKIEFGGIYDSYAYFYIGNDLVKINIDTLEKTTILESEDEIYGIDIRSDGIVLVTSSMFTYKILYFDGEKTSTIFTY